MARRIFYLCEIGAGLDSGMTLQVLRDYGSLSKKGWNVSIPVTYARPEEWSLFSEFVDNQCGELKAIPYDLQQRRWRASPLRLLSTLIRALVHLRGKRGVIVIRERRHRLAAMLLRWLTGGALVSELHEGAFPRAGNRWRRRRFQRFLDALDGLVFTNASQREYLRERGVILPSRQIVLPNGVDFEHFSRARCGQSSTVHVLTYTGQFTSWKNLPLLFSSLARLDASFRLRIAGGKAGGDSAEYVGALAKEYGVDERVEYLGFLHPDELLARAIDQSSVLLVPLGDNLIARYATSPIKLIEYMATGIPVVAVNHPSVVALAGQESVHLSSTDPAEFAAAILAAVTEDEASRRRRRDNAKALAARHDHAARAAQFDRWLSGLAPQS